jgi:hypothetical protein
MARYRIDELKAGDVSLLIALLGKIGFSLGERGRMNLPIVWSKQLTKFRRIGHKLTDPRGPFDRTKHLIVTAFRC